jgi:hypothetical protein
VDRIAPQAAIILQNKKELLDNTMHFVVLVFRASSNSSPSKSNVMGVDNPSDYLIYIKASEKHGFFILTHLWQNYFI